MADEKQNKSEEIKIETPDSAADEAKAEEEILFAYDISILSGGEKFQPEDFGESVRVSVGGLNTGEEPSDVLHVKADAVNGAGADVCKRLMDAATTDACIEILDEQGAADDGAAPAEGLRDKVIESIMDAVQQKLEHRVKGNFKIGAVMFSNVYGKLGMTDNAKAILRGWEKGAKDGAESGAEEHKEDNR